jgi:2-amino-4-hydroxy-6-hydroxymethyldihydropteridine diphosphokinase
MPMSKRPVKPAPHFDAAIGLGSNIGDKSANIDWAIALLTADGRVKLIARSRNYRSAPWGISDQDWFVNACVTVQTQLSARALLKLCQDVENNMGRVRKQKWGPRLIDVDILTFRDQVISDPDLTVPHPLISERGFVLIPLMEIAPDIVLNGRNLQSFIEAIDTRDVVAMEDESLRK